MTLCAPASLSPSSSSPSRSTPGPRPSRSPYARSPALTASRSLTRNNATRPRRISSTRSVVAYQEEAAFGATRVSGPSRVVGSPATSSCSSQIVTSPPSILLQETFVVKGTRILIAADRSLFRDGLRKLLEAEPQLTVAGEARDAEEAVTLVEQLQPDVLLL